MLLHFKVNGNNFYTLTEYLAIIPFKHKDDMDRIWIGTQNGITLLNGLEIKKFGSEHGLPSALILLS